MSTKPVDELANQIRSLETEVASLQSDVRLARLRDAAEDLGTTAGRLVERVKEVRARGYAFEKALETNAADLERQWATLRPRILTQIDKEATSLERELRLIEGQMKRLVAQAKTPAAARPLLERAGAAVDALQGKARSAERSIEGMYDTFKAEVDELVQHLQRVDWMLGQIAEAKLQLLPTEAGIMAVKAKWTGGEDEPEGVVYLTDQRLIFEQKQEVAKKKVLFITTEKEKVQQLLLDVPLAQVVSVEASKKGLMGHEDHIDLTLAPGASVSTAHFHLDGQDCNMWQGLIGRAKAGDFDRDRAVPIDRKAEKKAKGAPSKCPNCGAPITQQVVRGMDSLKCEFCGYVIRL